MVGLDRVVAALEAYCTNSERPAVQGTFLWIDYASGVGRSKVTPAVLDRACGGSVTMRNVKTLHAVIELGA